MTARRHPVVETTAPSSRRGASDDAGRLWAALDAHGLLLVHDAALPSASCIIAGEPVRGSWWSHPAGKRIFGALASLEDRSVAVVPLVRNKQTLVAPRLVPALVAACGARDAWQRGKLDRAGTALLRRIENAGLVRADALLPAQRLLGKKLAAALLCASRQEHTERGAHATVLESWSHLGARTGQPPLATAELGRRAIEEGIASWAPRDARTLPWQLAR